MKKTVRFIVIGSSVAVAIAWGLIPAAAQAEKLSKSRPRILRSASELDYPPFALVRPDGSADGFSVDLLKSVARTTGWPVDITVGPWHKIKQKLMDGHLDVLPLVSYSRQRDKVFDFTIPYLRMHGTIFVRKGETSIRTEADLKDKEVIVMQGDTAHEYALRKKLSDKLILTDSFAEAMQRLSAGKHDAVVIQQLVGLQLIKKMGISNLVDVSPYQEKDLKPDGRPLSGFEQKFCLAVQEGDRKLLALLNEGLAIVIANGTYDELYTKWFSPILPHPKVPLALIARYLALTLVPLLLFLALTVLCYLRYQVAKKTRNLRREVEERKTATRQLLQSQTRLQSIFRAAPTGIGLVIDRVIKDANGRLCAMVGYAQEELIGKNARRLYLNDADYEYVGRVQSEQIRRHGTGTVETRWRRKDGQHIHVLLSSTPIDVNDRARGVTFTALDITDRKRSEEMLRLTQFSVDHASDASFWIGPDARFIYVNDAACRNLGYAREELLTMTVHDIDPQFGPRGWQDHWSELRQRGTLLFETAHHRKDGKTIAVEVCANYLAYAGKEYNHAFARDITERKQAEKERLLLERQMLHAQKLESLGVLAGGIAHDFNNILMTILGNADIALQDMSLVSPVRNNVHEIEKAARHAAELSKQMLAYSGRGTFVIEPIRLNAFIKEMANMLEVSISKKAVLNFKLADNLPVFDGDATQIRQIIMNLIINASEAIGDKSGIITISTGVMDCNCDYLNTTTIAILPGLSESLPAGVYVYIEVADTGCGMDSSTQDKLFDPFFTTKFTGRGLGMAAVQGIVRSHKGTVKVYSEVDKGTTFKVLLPASESTGRVQTRQADARPKGTWRGNGSVLIADDEAAVCAVGKLMLERMGFNVLTAADGREALRVFRAHTDKIVCVLLDLTMPHLSGEEVFREMRLIRPDIKVIISSGYNENDTTQRFVGKGLAGFIQKPYNSNLLAVKIREVLGSAQ